MDIVINTSAFTSNPHVCLNQAVYPIHHTNHSSDNGLLHLRPNHYFQIMINSQYKHSELTAKIIGCAMTVHQILGNGFQELVYQRALELEMQQAGLGFSREFEMPIIYKGQQIATRRVDFLVEGVISVELKATTKLEDVHLAQAINYLEAYNLEIGLLINFGEMSLNFKRLANKKFKELNFK